MNTLFHYSSKSFEGPLHSYRIELKSNQSNDRISLTMLQVLRYAYCYNGSISTFIYYYTSKIEQIPNANPFKRAFETRKQYCALFLHYSFHSHATYKSRCSSFHPLVLSLPVAIIRRWRWRWRCYYGLSLLTLANDIPSVNHSRKPAEDRQQNIDNEIGAASSFQED